MRENPEPTTRPTLVKATAGAVLVGTCGRLLLQRRDDKPWIDFPNAISLFGGHLEPGESPRTCVAREIAEETGHNRRPEEFRLIMDIRTDDPLRGEIAITAWLLRDVPTDDLVITEGTLEAIALADVGHHWRAMTPMALFAVRQAIDAMEDE